MCNDWLPSKFLITHVALFVITAALSSPQAIAQDESQFSNGNSIGQFEHTIAPLLQKYCVRCHDADQTMSGIRVDQLSGSPPDSQLTLLKGISDQIADKVMPPEDELQPTQAERAQILDWTDRTRISALTRKKDRFGTVRRLTVAQYQNTLCELLHLDDDLTGSLPPDAVSKDGFINNAQTLFLSPLQVETYFDIAEKALSRCIDGEQNKPSIQNFRMDIGEHINPTPYPDKLILGHLSHLLDNSDFTVTQLAPEKPFAFQPRPMQTHFEFIEGYVGNDTVRQWRAFDSIYHAVFACLRGTPDYPKGDAAEVVGDGLLLRPAVPSSEIFGVSNTYGPMANFKVVLRELPEEGNFRVTVKAARYDDGLLVEPRTTAASAHTEIASIADPSQISSSINVNHNGIYLINVAYTPSDKSTHISLQVDGRRFSGSLPPATSTDDKSAERKFSFIVLRLTSGNHEICVRETDNSLVKGLNFIPVEEHEELGKRFIQFESRAPRLGVHLGLRRDCGSTLNVVGQPQIVSNLEPKEFIFSGSIGNFPSPNVEPNNVNYLAGLREIAVRSEFTDGRDAPRLQIQSIEFEGPYFDHLPSKSNRSIFIESPNKEYPNTYAREILDSFATHAFRRPVTHDELQSLCTIWKQYYDASENFNFAIKNALTVVLTSPQFLFIIEESDGPEADQLSDYELASKLSYFLWNGPPDDRLLSLAASNELRLNLEAEIDRMIDEPRFSRSMEQFVSQWLALDKFDVVSIDSGRFPNLTKHAKQQLRREPIEFIQYLIRQNLPLTQIINSDFILANEVVAAYYGLGTKTESGFEFIPIRHNSDSLGGVLSQAAVLSGLSDGREANPVKRGAWFARKIIGEPPPDPPPNVPQLPKDAAGSLTLRQKIEQHRSQKGCAKCHEGIDPWGLPFEQYDAAGLFQSREVDCVSRLPDGQSVANVNQLKQYLIEDRMDQVAFCFVRHLACYAAGRTLTYSELEFIKNECILKQNQGYHTRDLIKLVVASDIFQKK